MLKLIFILVGILLLFQAWRLVIIFIVMKRTPKFPANTEFKTLLPYEIPIPVQEAFAKTAEALQMQNLTKVTDFSIEGMTGYWCLYWDQKEKTIAQMFCTEVKDSFYFALYLSTYFTNDTKVLTANSLPSDLPGETPSNETLRFFPDCIPEDLIRLHKEYVASYCSQLEKKDLPKEPLKFLAEESQEGVERKIKQGKLKKGEDDAFLKYSFLYHFSYVSFLLKEREGRLLKHPGLITDTPYTRGFAKWLVPGSLQAKAYHNNSPEQKKKRKKLTIYLSIIGVLLVLFYQYSLIRNKSADREAKYLQYIEEHNQKLYTFGQVQVSPLPVSLEKIEKWMETNYPQASRSLQPGISKEEMHRIIDDMPITIPEELYMLYSWHNGQLQTEAREEFIPAFSFLRLQDAVKTYKEMQRLGDETWPNYYFPILAFQDSFYVVLCSGERQGSVLQLHLESPEAISAYPSIAFFMQEIAENFETGSYYLDDEGILVVDRAKLLPVFKKYHPALTSEYDY